MAESSGGIRRYRIYLYFVATQDAAINIARVAQRVQPGGHDVPQDKQWVLLAEYEAPELHIKEEDIPVWFYQYVIQKIQDA